LNEIARVVLPEKDFSRLGDGNGPTGGVRVAPAVVLVDDVTGGALDGMKELGVGAEALHDGLVDKGPEFALPRAVVGVSGDEDDFVIGLSGEKFFFASGSGGGLPLGVDGFRDDDPMLVESEVGSGE